MQARILNMQVWMSVFAFVVISSPTRADDKADLRAALERAWATSRQGKHEEAALNYERALALATTLFGLDDERTATIQNNLAVQYEEMGQYAKAEPLYVRALATRETKLGKEHIDTAGTIHNLAILYKEMRQFAKSEPLFFRALAIEEIKLGKDHPKTAGTIEDLASLFVEMGQYTKAEPLFHRALSIREEKLGKDHVKTAQTVHNLAVLYKIVGDYAKAESLLQRALSIRENKLGKNHAYTAGTIATLGQIYEHMGRYHDAENYYQRALAIFEDKHGNEALRTAQCLGNLANLKMKQGDYAKAESCYLRELSIQEGRLGKEHPLTAGTVHNLSNLYQVLGQYAKAEELYLGVLKQCELKLGKDHPDTVNVVQSLALLHEKMGQYAKAEQLNLRALAAREAKLGKDHPGTAAIVHNLAILCMKMGQYAKAEQLFLRAFAIRETKLGKDHPVTADTINSLANLYYGVSQYAKAEPLYLRALAIKEAKAGKDHPDTAIKISCLANLYEHLSQYGKAEAFCLRALAICEIKLGADHPRTGTALCSLASLYQKMGQCTKAEPLFVRARHIYESRLGKDHPDTAFALAKLADLYEDMGDYNKAEPLAQSALDILRARLGKGHPRTIWAQEITASLRLLAGRQTEAVRVADQALHLKRANQVQVLPALGESEQLAYIEGAGKLDWFLSLALGGKLSDENAARTASWLVNGKAVAQQAVAERMLLAREAQTDESRSQLAELIVVRQELAKLALDSATRDPSELRTRKEELAEKERLLSAGLHQLDQRSNRYDPWVEFDELTRRLPEKSIFVDFARYEVTDFHKPDREQKKKPTRYAAWVTSRRGEVHVVDLGDADAIDAAVRTVRTALAEGAKTLKEKGDPEAEKDALPALERLANLLLKPLRGDLDGAEHWIICPDSQLWLVPWAALPLDSKTYAVEKHAIQLVVSGRDLMLDPLRLDFRPGRALVVADPDFDLAPAVAAQPARRPVKEEVEVRDLPRGLALGIVARLPGTAMEGELAADKLEKLYGEKPLVLTDRSASTSEVRRVRSPRALVLATHGYFISGPEPTPDASSSPKVQENPLLRSGLLLAGCNRAKNLGPNADVGVLTGLDVVGLDLRGTQLVVLSACETGLGEVRNGEGVAGLRQAFQLAGAESVVATLWQVNDRASALLMAEFFERLAKKESRVKALRNAQLDLIQKRRARFGAAHPYFWAAYTLTGQAAVLEEKR
jgi:CHAT domain-containing protein